MGKTIANPLMCPPSRDLPRHVAIIGAGTIGPDIGYYLKSALPEIRLTLVDVAQPAIDKALQRCRDYASKAVARGKMTEAHAKRVTANISGTLDYGALADCDWVIEAATENIELKRQIFARVEAVVGERTLITSNTSSLPASRIFAGLRQRGRATVTHFFAPAWRNPAVEVIDWPDADPDVIEYLRWLFCATGKVPLVTTDAVCFMLDRIFDNWCNDAALLLDRATAAQVDSVATEFVNAGPFFVLNLANGNPIITETNTLQADEEGEHYRPATVFRSVKEWLTIPPGKSLQVDPAITSLARDRLLGVLFSQTVDILDREIGDPSDLELGCKTAFGFKNGPLDLMRDLGEAETCRILQAFAVTRPGMPMPARLLADYQKFHRHILVDDLDGVRIITLRRPEALNALNDDMTNEILEVVRRSEADPAVTGFVITGYGMKAFCAGAEIGRFAGMLGDEAAATRYSRDCSRLLVHLDAMTKPVVAALNGMTLGGGLELAMRCHALLAVKDAWMQLPEITLGIVPGIGAMVVPFRRWPRAADTFAAMLGRAERVGATRLHELGVIDDLVGDIPTLIRRAVERVHTMAGQVGDSRAGPATLPVSLAYAPVSAAGAPLSRQVLTILEQALRDAAAEPALEAALEIGYCAFGRSACTAAAREGIAAFGEGRTPDFSDIP